MQKCGYCERSLCACHLGFSVSYRHIAHRSFRFTSKSVLSNTLYQSSAMSRYTREYGRTSSWNSKESAPLSKHNARNSHSEWSKRGTRGNPALTEVHGHLTAALFAEMQDARGSASFENSETRGGPVTLPAATKLTWKLRMKFLSCRSSAGIQSERFRTCGRDRC